MAEQSGRGEARIHWLVIGRFTLEPRGESLRMSPVELEKKLAERVPSVRARVPDRLGGDGTRDFEISVRGLRTFTLAGMVEACPALAALEGLARLPASAEELIAEVESIAGPGKLATACAEALPSPVDDAPVRGGAAAAVDAFAKSTATTSRSPGSDASRRLKQVLETAVYGSALDLLRSDPVRGLEASWRGLRMLLAACPAQSDLEVEILDVASDDLVRAIRSRPANEGFEGPDALFVIEPVQSLDVLAELADVAEEMLAPCVTAVAPELLGAPRVSQLAERVSHGEPLPPEWTELRGLGAARWLCAVVNPLALYAEGAGAYKRIAFGSPAWAVATMLSTSYRAQGAVAGIVGRGGAIEAPAAWTIPAGAGAGTRAPTEAFLALAAQRDLAAQGLVALGSTRDADRVVLAAAPMVGGDLPLPAQILTGRIVRFSRWTARQMDPTLPPDEVSTLFQQAAQVFLSPGMAGAAALGAQVRGEGSNRVLRVAARVEPTRALVPLSIEFDLPM